MQILLPDAVKNIIQTLSDHGHEAYAVGGCVRDCVLGREPSDWDITTDALPMEVKEIFPVTIDTGIKHGTVTVLSDHVGYEVTTYRIDGEYEDGRHPNDVTFTRSLEEDLARRDFTINAMAYNDDRGIVDLYGGCDDLNKHIIRCVGDPDQRFSEDALRMLRAIRFAAQLGFDIDENTKQAISDHASDLSKVSAERIRVELIKLLVSDHPELIDLARELGLTAIFLPEWDKMASCEQNTPHHIGTVAVHTIRVVKALPPDPVLRMAGLLHDVAKPVSKKTDTKGQDHFVGHPILGAQMSRKIMRRLTFDSASIDRVEKLVTYHDDRTAATKRAVRRLAARIGSDLMEDLITLRRADISGQSDYRREEKMELIDQTEKVFHEIMNDKDALTVKDLAVDGRDIMNAGVGSGPVLGEILKAMLEEVLEDPAKNTKEYLMSSLNDIRKKIATGLFAVLIMVMMIPMLSACGSSGGDAPLLSSNRRPSTPYTPPVEEETEEEETQATADQGLEGLYIVEMLDTADESFVLKSLETTRQMRYKFGLGTTFYDTRGTSISVTRFVPGKVVEIEMVPGENLLKTVTMSSRVWVQEEVDNFTLDIASSTLSIGSSVYRIKPETEYFSMDIAAYVTDIGDNDILTITGLDRDILTVSVDSGHGFLSLVNTDLFVDSLICVGDKNYELITGDMIMEVPEGTYDVTVANDGYGGTKTVTVGRNETVTLDLNELKGEGPKMCELTFRIAVDGAAIYLDGTEVMSDTTMDVEYGRHSLVVTADGYSTWSRTLFVNSPSAEIYLDPSSGSDDSGSSSSQSNSNASSNNSDTSTNTTTNTNTSNTSNTSTSSASSGNDQSTGDAEIDYLTTISNMIDTIMGD